MKTQVVLMMFASVIAGCPEPGPTPAAKTTDTPREAPMYGIVIHGGAGTIKKAKIGPEREAAARAMLARARDAGYAVLAEGGSAVDAVESTLVMLEDSDFFNAGRGAVLTNAGTVEMDASIMDGASGQAGAVAGVKTIRNPIRAARRVMDVSPHVMLAGEGADVFAHDEGLATEPPAYFITKARQEQLERAQKDDTIELDHASPASEDDKHGTVGAVARDQAGHLAAGTSTGGMVNKRWGRVGDSPIIGAGTWARDSTCAVSSTGHGEFFIREAVAHAISARMAHGGQSLQAAADAVIFDVLKPMKGTGGVIAIDHLGRIAMPYNTLGMYRAWRRSDGDQGVAIWED